ncbi:hypothetical protein HMPREF1544_00373 [Mucor circinelloides 1006PhL]|uniref:Uncharacterized protein n=1 Tax=Mucor circinelloides f. circinelloides (strain 1006PhL) TaxID=1220926 RepID=S2JRL9_MUCC1|nr:hypothetical protein HMPREF1544_00373 [Mucor circinelloides 1006PhL]
MPDQHKWKFSTSTVVEDAMFEFGMKLVKEHLQEVFSKSELYEINQFESEPLAIVPQQLKNYINTFAVNDCKLLRQKIDAAQKWQTGYDLNTKRDFDWVRNTVYNLVCEYEANSYSHDHLEGWYTVHLWRLFDTVFDVLQDIEVSRFGA